MGRGGLTRLRQTELPNLVTDSDLTRAKLFAVIFPNHFNINIVAEESFTWRYCDDPPYMLHDSTARNHIGREWWALMRSTSLSSNDHCAWCYNAPSHFTCPESILCQGGLIAAAKTQYDMSDYHYPTYDEPGHQLSR
jgi:hypothetical protein